MNRYDSSYSAYYKEPNDDYPVGSAVDVTSEDRLDGTPYLAKFFNDVIGFMQAVFFDVNGKGAQVSNTPETAQKSDVWGSIKKFVGDAVSSAQKLLNDAIGNEAETRKNADDKLNGDIAAINAKIPAQASANNQLADKDFVNSSIATNTAYFIGTFESLDKLNAYSGTKTNNDYAFVKTTDAAGNTLYNRYKWNGSQWLFEYTLNNSSFTQAQWNAINSGATAAKINLIKNMTGASATAAGSAGFVPAPTAGQQGSFLRGDGTWQSVSNISAQGVFDAVRPVGSTYVQYPQQDDPNTLFNKNGVTSTWSIVNYDGAFFRAQGGNAAAFLDKNSVLVQQSMEIQEHSHRLVDSGYGLLSGRPHSGRDSGSAQTPDNLAQHFETLSAGGIETRPVNYTIRIWKRTA